MIVVLESAVCTGCGRFVDTCLMEAMNVVKDKPSIAHDAYVECGARQSGCENDPTRDAARPSN